MLLLNLLNVILCIINFKFILNCFKKYNENKERIERENEERTARENKILYFNEEYKNAINKLILVNDCKCTSEMVNNKEMLHRNVFYCSTVCKKVSSCQNIYELFNVCINFGPSEYKSWNRIDESGRILRFLHQFSWFGKNWDEGHWTAITYDKMLGRSVDVALIQKQCLKTFFHFLKPISDLLFSKKCVSGRNAFLKRVLYIIKPNKYICHFFENINEFEMKSDFIKNLTYYNIDIKKKIDGIRSLDKYNIDCDYEKERGNVYQNKKYIRGCRIDENIKIVENKFKICVVMKFDRNYFQDQDKETSDIQNICVNFLNRHFKKIHDPRLEEKRLSFSYSNECRTIKQ